MVALSVYLQESGAAATQRPPEYELSSQRFVELLGHEVGSHLLERINGERGPLQLALSGFDRKLRGGEGRALMREQVVGSTFEEFGKQERWCQGILKRHIAISYAMGVGEEGMKSSSEVCQFIYAMNSMYCGVQISDEQEAQRPPEGKPTA